MITWEFQILQEERAGRRLRGLLLRMLLRRKLGAVVMICVRRLSIVPGFGFRIFMIGAGVFSGVLM